MSRVEWRRPLIVGASGQVGGALAAELRSTGACEAILRSSREPKPGWLALDLAELATLGGGALAEVEAAAPDAIFCVGGMTFVDGCEHAPDVCRRANATGPARLAEFAAGRGIPFVFFSSDYVFGGTEEAPGPYGEGDAPRPLSVYGASKLEGERAVLEAHPGALVVRTTIVYGPDAAGKNFLYTLLRQLSVGKAVRVAADQVSTPTYNRDLAGAVHALVRAGVAGMVHVAGPELMDRLQFARQVAAHFGLDQRLLEGVSTASLGQVARRPLFSGLVTDRLVAMVPGLRRHTVAEALRDCDVELREFLAELDA